MSEEKQSLYSALFPYRPRFNDRSAAKGEKRGREPLEDFLTSALTDLLNRLAPREMKDAIEELFLDESSAAAWKRLCERQPETRLTWSAQQNLEGAGRCDIVLNDEKGPLLIIEAKIRAGYSESHSRSSSSEEDKGFRIKDRHQLVRYGQWLSEKCKTPEWRGALVLLTHFTEPPDDFISNEEEKYHVEFTSVCRWSRVFLWLKKLGQKNSKSNSQSVYFLANQLEKFLEEDNMNSETITIENLDAAKPFVIGEHAERIAASFSAIRGRLKPALKKLTEKRTIVDKTEERFSLPGSICDYCFFKSSGHLRDWCVEWGLCWPESPWAIDLRKHGHSIPGEVLWYIAVYDGGDNVDVQKNTKDLSQLERDLPNSWKIWKHDVDSGLFTVRGVSELLGDGNIDKVAEWMVREIQNIRPVVTELTRRRAAATKTRRAKTGVGKRQGKS